MSAVPDEGGTVLPPPLPLGQLLIERGFLSEEQLASALAHQARSGSPLGELLVELGYVPAALIAQALATQHGGLLKTEYGFATGFTNGSPSPSPAAPPPILEAPPRLKPGIPALRVMRAEPVETPTTAPEAPVEAAAPAAAAPEATAQPIAPPAPAPQPVEAAPVPHAAELEAALAAARHELETLRSRTDELERERDAARTRADEASQRAEALEGIRRELEAELASVREAQAEPPPGPPVTEHFAFVGGPNGYALVECPGAPPAVGCIVELPEESGVPGRHLVVRAGRATLPGSDAACVHLLAVD